MEKRTRIKDQSESLDKLMELRREHPDYPIIPMVDGNVVEDPDYGRTYWMGRLGEARIRKLYSGNMNVHEYDPELGEDELYPALDDTLLDTGDVERAEEDPEYARELYNELPWQDCIVIYIDTP